MDMETVDWVKSIIKQAALEVLHEEPKEIIILSRIEIPIYPDLPSPVRASLIMDKRTLIVSVNIYRDGRYSSFNIHR